MEWELHNLLRQRAIPRHCFLLLLPYFYTKTLQCMTITNLFFCSFLCLIKLELKCYLEKVPLPTVIASSNCSMQVPVQERKRRLSIDQIESLERSFQEEIKLEPKRKMRLAQELGLQPRQVAVWFQNRRARWKAKQLERVYCALKQDFEAVSREKLKLQQEVSIFIFFYFLLKILSNLSHLLQGILTKLLFFARYS